MITTGWTQKALTTDVLPEPLIFSSMRGDAMAAELQVKELTCTAQT